MPHRRWLLRLLPAAFFAHFAASGVAFGYEKATEGGDVVMNKLFPKKSKVELDGKFGVVLNSSYEQTLLGSAGLTYFFSEEWGLNLEGNFAMTSDKAERTCIETFYNDPNYAVGDECGASSPKDQDPQGDANWGPAYVPIRQLKYIFTANMVWNPIYGKQIVLLSATNYFDFFFTFGGGLAMSDFYPKRTTFADGKLTRNADFCTKQGATTTGCKTDSNPGTDDDTQIGVSGRPLAQSESNVTIHVGLGQRFHFLKRFLLTAGLENYTLIGTESGFDNFFTLMGGLGVRF